MAAFVDTVTSPDAPRRSWPSTRRRGTEALVREGVGLSKNRFNEASVGMATPVKVRDHGFHVEGHLAVVDTNVRLIGMNQHPCRTIATSRKTGTSGVQGSNGPDHPVGGNVGVSAHDDVRLAAS